MPESAVLKVSGLRHDYAGQPALQCPDLTLTAGEHLLVLGPSGSGKSTLLHALAGLLRPSEGCVHLVGRNLAQMSPAQCDALRGRTLGIILQRLHLLPALSVIGNLLLAQRLAGQRPAPAAALALLESLDVAAQAGQKPGQLSVGQAQRVAIARALVHRPRLVLADEPTSSLDDVNARRVITVLQEHAAAVGASLVIVTHDQRLRPHFAKYLQLEAPACSG